MKTPMAPKLTALKNKHEKSAFKKKKKKEGRWAFFIAIEYNCGLYRSILLQEHTDALSIYCFLEVVHSVTRQIQV